MKKCLIMKTTKTQKKIFFFCILNNSSCYIIDNQSRKTTIISFINQIFIAVIYQYFLKITFIFNMEGIMLMETVINVVLFNIFNDYVFCNLHFYKTSNSFVPLKKLRYFGTQSLISIERFRIMLILRSEKDFESQKLFCFMISLLILHSLKHNRNSVWKFYCEISTV